MGCVTGGIANIAKAKGLTDDEAQLATDLVRVLQGNAARNADRMSYYEGENALKNIGIAIPPELAKLQMACSWPAKAVDELADRSVLDGVTFRSGEDVAGIGPVLDANHIKAKYDRIKPTELVHGPAFWTLSAGPNALMPVIIRAHDALNASGLWDDQLGHLSAGLVIAGRDRRPGRSNRPNRVNLYTSDAIIELALAGNGRWVATRKPHPMGRPLIEAMVHRPTAAKPLGTSRITHAVMSITDCAMREALRTEMHAEVYTSPQKYLLGATKEQVDKIKEGGGFSAFVGSLFALGVNDEGDAPEFGQLSQPTIDPHVSYLRQLAAQFSGATDVPMSYLGIVHDNPSSAEAIHAAEQPLVVKAEAMNQDNSVALENVVRMAVAIKKGKPLVDLTPDEAGVVVGFRRPDRPSMASSADAALKIASTPGMEWFGGTEVCLRMMGFTEQERLQMAEERRRAEGLSLVGSLMGGNASTGEGGGSSPDLDKTEVAGKALNGSQTQSLIAIMAQHSSGHLSDGQAVNLISTAIGITKEAARGLLEGKVD